MITSARIYPIHDCFYDHILPVLFRINTNYILLVYKLISKRAYKKLYHLLYQFLLLFISGDGDDLVSCDPIEFIATVNREKLILELLNINKVDENTNIPRLLMVRGGVEPYINAYVFYEETTIYHIIIDESIPFDLRMKYLLLYYEPWEKILDDNRTLGYFVNALACQVSVSQEVRRIISPHFGKIIKGLLAHEFILSFSNILHVLVTDDQELQEITFGILNELTHDKKSNLEHVYDLSCVCMNLNPIRTMDILGLDYFFDGCSRFYLSNGISEDFTSIQNRYHIRGTTWDKEGNTHLAEKVDMIQKTQDFIDHINRFRTSIDDTEDPASEIREYPNNTKIHTVTITEHIDVIKDYPHDDLNAKQRHHDQDL